MKRTVFKSNTLIFLVVFAALTSCISSQSFMPVKGSGMLVDKTFNISDFHGIEVSGGGDVIGETPVNVPELDVEISAGYITGAGDVYYSGNPEIITIDAKGGSEIHKQ